MGILRNFGEFSGIFGNSTIRVPGLKITGGSLDPFLGLRRLGVENFWVVRFFWDGEFSGIEVFWGWRFFGMEIFGMEVFWDEGF